MTTGTAGGSGGSTSLSGSPASLHEQAGQALVTTRAVRPPRAMLLAAGLGTRLGALSDERPKPLLPVADLPILRYGLALVAGHGIREVVVNLHHHGPQIEAEVARALDEGVGRAGGGGDGGGPALAVRFSHEPEILGTGGGLRAAADWLTRDGEDAFLVLNGKLVTDIDLGAVLAAHRASGAVATMVVREVPDAERWGAVDVDAEGRVLRIIGQGRAGAARRRTMFTGVHVVSPSLVGRLPAGVSDSIRHGYLPALAAGELVGAVLYDGYFQEHSTPARYLEGNHAVVRGEARLSHPPGPLTGVDDSAEVDAGVVITGAVRVGPGARLGRGAVIGPDTVIGRGAVVAPGARVRRSVVWSGARVEGDVDHAIVTPRGVWPVAVAGPAAQESAAVAARTTAQESAADTAKPAAQESAALAATRVATPAKQEIGAAATPAARGDPP